VNEKEAARLLGVSVDTLEAYLASGDIATVLTPEGDTQIPRAQLLELKEEMDKDSSDLAMVMAARGQAAKALTAELLPALTETDRLGHRPAELRSLVYHRAVAQRLDERLLAKASSRLADWSRDGRIHPHWADKWSQLLAKPLPQVAAEIGSDTPEAQALRQSTPFAGALTEQERQQVLELVAQALEHVSQS
jgi:hypothetical protein